VLATRYGGGPVYGGIGVTLIALGVLVLLLRPRPVAEDAERAACTS
jgi:hypothetical protein